MDFFAIKRKPSAGLSLQEQQNRWMPQFLKAFMVVFMLYFASYLLRGNMDVGKKIIGDKYGFDAEEIGTMVLGFSTCYGLGKSVLGFIADGRNTKKVLSILIMCSGVINVTLGALLFTKMKPTVLFWTIFVIWGLNGLLLSVGGPCSYSTIMRWMPSSKQGTWLGRWNVSHNVGGAFAGIVAARSAEAFFNGEVGAYYVVPGFLGIMIGLWGLFFGSDDPSELGWDTAAEVWNEPLDEEEQEDEVQAEKESKLQVVSNYVANNPWVWMLCLANVFVYLVRMGISNWAPYYAQVRGIGQADSANLKIAFEASAFVGSLIFGWLSDKVHGRRMLIAGTLSLITLIGIHVYSKANTLGELTMAMIICGLLVFGPQLLIGVSVVKFVPLKAVAIANGLTGTAGYLLGDVGANKLIPLLGANNKSVAGWQSMFKLMYFAAIAGAVVMYFIATKEERNIRAEEAANKKL